MSAEPKIQELSPADVQAENQRPEDRPNALALASLMVGAFMPPLDFFIVNLALPDIGRALHAGSTELQLVVSAYACAFSVFLIAGGRLGDLYGRKRLYMLGMAGFIAASALCACASTGWTLVAWRMLQGLAAAAMVPQVLAAIRTVFSPKQQTMVMSLYGFVIGIAAVTGQLGGGVLVSLRPLGLGWPVIFLINVPIGLIALFGVWRYVPENRKTTIERVDYLGMALLSLFLFLIIYPLSQGREWGWPKWTFAMLLMSAPTLAILIIAESRLGRRHGDPMLDLGLFKNPIFSLSLLLTFMFYLDSAFFLTYGILLQNGLHWTALASGLAILPFGVGAIIGPTSLPALGGKIGNHVLAVGFGALALGFLASCEALSPGNAPTSLFYAGLLMAGIGHGMVLPTTTRIAISEVSAQKAGLASGITTSVLQLGAAFGATTVSGVFFSVLHGSSDPVVYGQAYQATTGVLGVLFIGCVCLSELMVRRQQHRTGLAVKIEPASPR